MTARVSVVMSAWNAQAVIGRAVESIVGQTYRDWEMVIVDDGSTDGTGRLLEQAVAAEPRIRVFRNDRNRGLAASLNRGWGESSGELIARMDADDVSLPDRLARQVAYLDEHPDVAILGTAVELVDVDGRSIGIAHRPEWHDELERRMFKETPFFHPTVLLRREVYETLGGYDERLRRAQDVDLWLRAYRRFEFHNLPDVLLRYTVPSRLPLPSCFWGTYVLARAAYRERALLRRGWYAPRFLAATLLARYGLRQLRFG
jgi:glycosyltransferase involved in cell wall biosynthesis